MPSLALRMAIASSSVFLIRVMLMSVVLVVVELVVVVEVVDVVVVLAGKSYENLRKLTKILETN